MLTQHPKTVCLSLMALDLPLWSVVEATATLYEKDPQRFHLLLPEADATTVDALPERQLAGKLWPAQGSPDRPPQVLPPSRFLWLELSPYRVTLTMQTHGKFSYRHYWERGVFGLSRFCLQGDDPAQCDQIQLRNYTRALELTGDRHPQHLRVEYELWANQLQLGHYVLNLDIANPTDPSSP